MIFDDRRDAGARLAAACVPFRASWPHPVVVGIPRGGVPVAAPVASALGAPLDVVVARKLGVPGNAELAMGAIGEGVRELDDGLIRVLGVTAEEVARVEARERVELARRVARYREGRKAVGLAGATVVVVDDGVATGSTARAACAVAREQGAAAVVLAVPVAPPDWEPPDVDALVCVERPRGFFAVGQWYRDFTQTTDAEVRELLGSPAAGRGAATT